MWSLDGVRIKTHPEGSRADHWLAAGLDEDSRLIIECEVTDSKSGHDATGLLDRTATPTGVITKTPPNKDGCCKTEIRSGVPTTTLLSGRGAAAGTKSTFWPPPTLSKNL